ncbi:MAG: dockerin type I repeat-containing protein [Lachnospiraceae bacterium]
MKKLFTALAFSVGALCLGGFAAAAPADAEPITADVELKLGDMTGDQQVDAQDALSVLQIAAQLGQQQEMSLFQGDLNQDGVLNAEDALVILNIAAQLEEPRYAASQEYEVVDSQTAVIGLGGEAAVFNTYADLEEWLAKQLPGSWEALRDLDETFFDTSALVITNTVVYDSLTGEVEIQGVFSNGNQVYVQYTQEEEWITTGINQQELLQAVAISKEVTPAHVCSTCDTNARFTLTDYSFSAAGENYIEPGQAEICVIQSVEEAQQSLQNFGQLVTDEKGTFGGFTEYVEQRDDAYFENQALICYLTFYPQGDEWFELSDVGEAETETTLKITRKIEESLVPVDRLLAKITVVEADAAAVTNKEISVLIQDESQMGYTVPLESQQFFEEGAAVLDEELDVYLGAPDYEVILSAQTLESAKALVQNSESAMTALSSISESDLEAYDYLLIYKQCTNESVEMTGFYMDRNRPYSVRLYVNAENSAAVETDPAGTELTGDEPSGGSEGLLPDTEKKYKENAFITLFKFEKGTLDEESIGSVRFLRESGV